MGCIVGTGTISELLASQKRPPHYYGIDIFLLIDRELRPRSHKKQHPKQKDAKCVLKCGNEVAESMKEMIKTALICINTLELTPANANALRAHIVQSLQASRKRVELRLKQIIMNSDAPTLHTSKMLSRLQRIFTPSKWCSCCACNQAHPSTRAPAHSSRHTRRRHAQNHHRTRGRRHFP